ncbi:neurolysin/thimet oligopeptidase [Vitreoscilla sp. C1]|uniref:M3 family metallopeptidase n=1 Tax=Vitreoscilla sp. (strain C1) TaxID=96942 RepID=UPI00148EA105|nr:M3 family metallopeptidase [Vitreoscilla sp. C1]QJQ52114.1 neurolysin/thimet oligopeptidase [Vitreoscilla sp. C1]
MSENVLLQLHDEPRYDAIETALIAPAMKQAMTEAQAAIEALKAQEAVTWDNTVTRLTDITETVGRIWGVVSHLNSVVDTPQLRTVYNELMPEVTQFFTAMSLDIQLYERFKTIAASEAFAQLTAAQQKKLNNDLRDFVLSGAELNAEDQQIFAALQTESAQLSAQFSQNLMDATDAFALYFDDASELAGLPEDTLAMFAAGAQAEGKTGYKIGLQIPHYLAVMQYADNRDLREKMYQAYVTRASDLGDAKLDNSANIQRILEIATQEAKLLGFDNYAQLSLATKMADTPEQVITFLRDLAAKARPFAEQDKAEVYAFAKEQLNLDNPQPWDLTYISEKLREAKYSFSEQEVKQYFPVSKVLAGLFAQIDTLYGITFAPKTVPTWHKDVRYYELMRDGKVFGGVYMDLFAREGKRGGAWMNDYRGRRELAEGVQTPIAYLVCNFTPPVNGKESRLTHDEILTMFHEMGHGLHHLLTKVDELGVSGINGVEWDAVELPSQFMENFVWELDVLSGMSEHEQTGEALPKALYDKMIAAKNFQSGLQTLRQIEFGLFDMMIYEQGASETWMQVLADVRAEVAVLPTMPYNRFAHSFGHIFAGGYSAGYYSYKWAELLSADAYSAFEETDDVAAMGQKFWQEVLAVGGSRDAMISFKAFRGREPQIDALLRHSGMLVGEAA